MLVIKQANEIRTNFFNKMVLGILIPKVLKFAVRKIQIIKLTNPEERIIPITPKL